MRAYQKTFGFTLVELIVVITIVGILSTVWFVSYSGYLTGARDSNRISQMIKLSDSLQVYSATKSLPLPDSAITITASGASNIIGYQWVVGVDVLETIDFTNGGVDPKDDTYFTYYLTKDRSSSQLLTYMEEQESLVNIFWKTYAIDYSDRYAKVYGRKLGVITSNTLSTINAPLQELGLGTSFDVVLATGSYIAYISDTEKITGTGGILRATIPDANCNRIKQVGGGSGNGVYIINPAGAGAKDAYCDMETSGGGWTMIARSVVGGTGTFALATATGSVSTGTTLPYMLWTANLIYTNTLLASYTTGRTIDSSKTLLTSNASLVSWVHTLTVSTLTGGVLGDGYYGKAGMLFVK